jgi:hypothetical protein
VSVLCGVEGKVQRRKGALAVEIHRHVMLLLRPGVWMSVAVLSAVSLFATDCEVWGRCFFVKVVSLAVLR